MKGVFVAVAVAALVAVVAATPLSEIDITQFKECETQADCPQYFYCTYFPEKWSVCFPAIGKRGLTSNVPAGPAPKLRPCTSPDDCLPGHSCVPVYPDSPDRGMYCTPPLKTGRAGPQSHPKILLPCKTDEDCAAYPGNVCHTIDWLGMFCMTPDRAQITDLLSLMSSITNSETLQHVLKILNLIEQFHQTGQDISSIVPQIQQLLGDSSQEVKDYINSVLVSFGLNPVFGPPATAAPAITRTGTLDLLNLLSTLTNSDNLENVMKILQMIQQVHQAGEDISSIIPQIQSALGSASQQVKDYIDSVLQQFGFKPIFGGSTVLKMGGVSRSCDGQAPRCRSSSECPDTACNCCIYSVIGWSGFCRPHTQGYTCL